MTIPLTDHEMKPPSMLHYFRSVPLVTSINKPESEIGLFLEKSPFKF